MTNKNYGYACYGETATKKLTDFAKVNGCYSEDKVDESYWLRSPHNTNYHMARYVSSLGTVELSNLVDNSDNSIGVAPCLTLNLYILKMIKMNKDKV